MSAPLILPLAPFPDSSAFPLAINIVAIANDGGMIMLSPVELIVDQPFYLGCFHLGAEGEHLAEQITSPHACLVHCSKNHGMRFALLRGGAQCSCLAGGVDYSSEVVLLPDSGCEKRCEAEPEFACGSGENDAAAALYVAGDIVVDKFFKF